MSGPALVILVCALMCPLVMGVMMVFMRKGHGESRHGPADRSTDVPSDGSTD